MNPPRLLLTRAATAAAFFFALVSVPTRAALDVSPADGIPDIWALRYSAGALSPTADTDGDGQKNNAEAAAGTNPAQPESVIKITSVTVDGAGVHLTFPTEEGKRYQVQTATGLVSPTWVDLGAPLAPAGSGSLTATNNAVGATSLFYRVRVQDIDSDGDGVSDWEEMQVGFDPYNAYSSGLGGPNDLAAITAGISQTTTVSVVSVDNVATEPANGGAATDAGAFVISRTGGFKAVTVFYNNSGSAATAGSDYTALSGSVAMGLGVMSVTVTVAPLEDAVVESPEAVVINLMANAAYSLGAPTQAGVIIDDRSGATGDGVFARYWNNTSVTNPQFTNTVATANIPVGPTPALSRPETQINNNWPDPTTPSTGLTPPLNTSVNSDYFVARYTANVMPEFSQVYTFKALYDRGVRLYVNGQLLFSNFSSSATANITTGTTGTIDLQAGKLYPLVFEYMARSGAASVQMLWSSANQAEQVVPQNRLFASAAPIILGSLDLLLLKDGPAANYQIDASGEPTSYSAANLPPGWTVNTGTGVISGPANTAGEWDVTINATNANGTGSALLHVKVLATGGAITRDVWSPVTGTAVSAIPLTTDPTSTGTVTLLEGPQNAADDYGARILGYITAPVSGVYKFFLTASDSAELYISDDDEPVNAFKRAQVTTATGYRDWTSANAGKSPLLQLYAGRRYYVEVRHKAGVGSDHVSVGWMQPGQGGNDPGAFVPATGTNVVVPGFVLSPYVPPTASVGESTLYVTNMGAQGAAVTNGYGSATLTLSADEQQATLKYSFANLTTSVTNQHIHADGYPLTSNIIFDIDSATPNQDGSYTWDIVATGTISSANIITAIKSGAAYINIHTVSYPSGEIRGNFRLAAASQSFTPPAPQTWTDPASAGNVDSHLNRNGAARFLVQATFGVSGVDTNPANGNPDDIDQVQSLGFEGWIDDQINNGGTTNHYPYVFANRNQTNPGGPTYTGALLFNSWWKNSVTAPDQLRQRLAFALSEILVTSEAGPLDDRSDALSDYYDMLLQFSFGNFKDLLVATTLHPAMGRYLDMLNNDKPDLATGRIPNENYAREIKQLFSIGLNRLHPDGSLVLNSKGELVPTYDQDAIIGFAHVFTGWSFYSATVNPYSTSFSGSSYLLPMTPRPARHFTGQKRTLNNVVLPGLATIGGVTLDPYAAHTTTQINNAAYQALPEAELDVAHEQLFRHPNAGPFVCRQLIQRFVTGTPSRGYLYRVVQKFENNGSGVRGDMKAVLKAILLDYEARSSVAAVAQGFGKQREPVVRVTGVARAFPSPANITGSYAQVGSQIDIITGANHLYGNNMSVFLDFAASTSGDVGQPLDATFTTLSTPATTATTFSVRVRSFEGDIEYTQANGITTFRDVDSATNDFSLAPGDSVAIEYVDGTPVVPVGGIDTVEYRSGDEYTIIFANPTTKRGTYSRPINSTTMTVSITAHGYTAGSTIHLEAVSGTPLPAIAIYTIDTATTNSFTVTTADAPTAARSGTIFATPPADLVASTAGNANLCRAAEFANRSGPLEVTYSDWGMDSTNTDLNQTPMQSPTVFNFFLPDYQFPGLLANAGLITPEFELTSETSVIRQANMLYSGLFNDALSTIGLSSFKNGARDIVLDLRPWLGNGPGGLPWTHTSNLDALIDELGTRLMAGKLSSTGVNNYASNPRVITNAKLAIKDYVQTLPPLLTAIESITNPSNPCEIRVTNHGLVVGNTVTVSGVTGGSFTAIGGGPSSINSTFTVVAVGSVNRFSVGIQCVNTTGINLTNARILPALNTTTARDRLRSVLHLLITSPDFTIQK